MTSQDGEPTARPPSVGYCWTALLGVLFIALVLLSFLLQVTLALVTLPLIFTSNGRLIFHSLQNRCIVSAIGVVVHLNLHWCFRTMRESAPGSSRDGEPSQMGRILFVNHRSNADPFFTAALLLRQCNEARFVYKSSLGKLPIVGWCVRLAGNLAVHFGDRQRITQMLQEARSLLEQGYDVVVFPEGTRSPSGLLQTFKASFFDLSAELGCDAVPVCMLGTERAWPHGGFKTGPASVTAVMGNPIRAKDSAQLKVEIADAMRRLAAQAVSEGAGSESDPMLTSRPYPWWKRPQHMQEMSEDEVMDLLRSGQGHERGANLA